MTKKLAFLGYGLRSKTMLQAFREIEADISVAAVAEQKTRCRSPGSGFLCGPPGTSAPTGALSAILCRDNHRFLPPCKSPENRVY